MKKSNALMLSYIIILFVSIIANAYFEWEGIDQVALAATMAGYFFALADYFGWETSYNQAMVDAKKNYLNTYRFYLNEVLDMANKDVKDLRQTIDLLELHRDSNEGVVEVLEQAVDLADLITHTQENANASLEKYPDRMKAVEEKEKKLKRFRFWESAWATMGFLIFFLLIIFDTLAEAIMPASSITTVAAFACIMFNYFLKDLLEASMQKEVAESAALCDEMKEKVASYNIKNSKTALLANAQKLVSDISKSTNNEEGTKNEQT